MKKMPIKRVTKKRTKKKCFFLMSQGPFNPKIRFLGQKVCPVACLQNEYRGHSISLSIFPSTYHQGSVQLK